LLTITADEEAESAQRINAAVELIGLMPEDAGAATSLLGSITPRTPASTSVGIIDALRSSRADGLSDLMLKAIDQFTPATRSALLDVMLARSDTTLELLTAIENGNLTQDDLSLGQQQALIRHPQIKVRSRGKDVLAKSGGLPNRDREQVLASLLSVTTTRGDTDRGKAVYLKNCANCHTHNGEGKTVGPDLSEMAVHPKAELLTQIIDPSRSVEGNYRSYSALTVDGLVINGMLASETQTTIEIIDPKGDHQVVLREELEKVVASNKSLMPDGFEKQIDPQGFTDLLEFLTSRGKYLMLPLRQPATAISTKPLFHGVENGPDQLVFRDWSQKMVGEVPFQLVDPGGSQVANIVLLNGPRGTMPPRMPKSVRILCNSIAEKIHLLSGVSGWGYPAHSDKSVSMTVRLHLAGGQTEDHDMINGVQMADYIRRVDVPGSKFAMLVRGQQLRHVVVEPKSDQVIEEIELIKGDDPTAPIVVAITVES
jgi:putative heme-binding domain-containing protein